MKVSVIITSYNYEQYIKDAIESVLNQTYSDFELVIIDDCSTDNSANIIKQFNDERIKFIQNEQNLGLKNSMQKAISCCIGEWIAFLDSDDLWKPLKLEKQIMFMLENNYTFSYHEFSLKIPLYSNHEDHFQVLHLDIQRHKLLI